eukprot:gene7444-7654_t
MRLVRLYSRLHASKLNDALLVEDRYWIGLNDRQTQGTFVWDSGGLSSDSSVADFQLWALGPSLEPNGPMVAGAADCVMVSPDRRDELWPPASGTWADEDCSERKPFVCGSVAESSDSCVRFPCSATGDQVVGCYPAAPAADQVAITHNRTCTCKPGLEYISDEVGCAEPYQFNTAEVTLVGAVHKMFFFPKVSWTEANRICCEEGMKLVQINDDDHAVQLSTAYLNSGGSSSYWIGLNDRAQENSFTWSTGAA